MTETVWSIENADPEVREALLDRLGYAMEGDRILDEDGNVVEDPCTGDPVHPQNMAIFPGSTVIVDDNPVSVAWYYENYRD